MIPEKAGRDSPTIELANQYPLLKFTPSVLGRFFEIVFAAHHHDLSGSLSIVFMDQRTHSELHGKYLQDYRSTDVITFPGDREDELAGEICVSVDQALKEADARSIPFHKELCLYLVHGWLHLVGFDDHDLVDRKIMREEEHRVLGLIEKQNAWPDFQLAPSQSQG